MVADPLSLDFDFIIPDDFGEIGSKRIQINEKG